jgi:hypothetical protein
MAVWQKTKAQSILEYVTLLAVIVSALLIMQFYVKRAYQGRLKDEADQVGQQYSPRHTTGLSSTFSQTTSTTCTGGKCFGADIPAGMTVTKSHSTSQVNKEEGVGSFAAEK